MTATEAAQIDPRYKEWEPPARGSMRKKMSRREVEEQGVDAVEALVDEGCVVEIVPEGRPGYVVVPAWLVDDWLDDLPEANELFVEVALAEVAAGKTKRYESVEAMMDAIHNYRDEE